MSYKCSHLCLKPAGGRWVINRFDVLEKTGGGRYALSYPAYNAASYYAGISRETTNAAGCDEILTPTDAPSVYRLAQNYPNPFNPMTTIKFDMKEKGLVALRIYDVSGRLVRTLVDEARDAGAYTIRWDGRNNIGAEVASGIYFYKMETAGFLATKKLVLLR
jgi:hypothetical protein